MKENCNFFEDYIVIFEHPDEFIEIIIKWIHANVSGNDQYEFFSLPISEKSAIQAERIKFVYNFHKHIVSDIHENYQHIIGLIIENIDEIRELNRNRDYPIYDNFEEERQQLLQIIPLFNSGNLDIPELFNQVIVIVQKIIKLLLIDEDEPLIK